jgi:DNA replication protein DnaC
VEFVEWAKIVALEPIEFRIWLAGMEDCDLLCLEDIGAEVDRFKSGEPYERLRELLNEFKRNFLFITTNLMPEQWGDKWDKRIADRLMRDSEIFAMRETESYANRNLIR